MCEHNYPFFVDSLGLMVVFKCSMTSSVWGNIATSFWGLLGVDGCIQMFGGVGTWLRLLFFHCLPIIFCSIW
jgi:hypothetical protein